MHIAARSLAAIIAIDSLLLLRDANLIALVCRLRKPLLAGNVTPTRCKFAQRAAVGILLLRLLASAVLALTPDAVLAIAALFCIQILLHKRITETQYGTDAVLRVFLIILVLRALIAPYLSASAAQLMWVNQIGVIYACSVVSKLRVKAWRNGRLVGLVLRSREFSRFRILQDRPLAANLSLAITHFVVALEVFISLVSVHPLDLAHLTAWGAVLLHLGIAVILRVELFSFVMLAVWVPVLLWEPSPPLRISAFEAALVTGHAILVILIPLGNTLKTQTHPFSRMRRTFDLLGINHNWNMFCGEWPGRISPEVTVYVLRNETLSSSLWYGRGMLWRHRRSKTMYSLVFEREANGRRFADALCSEHIAQTSSDACWVCLSTFDAVHSSTRPVSYEILGFHLNAEVSPLDNLLHTAQICTELASVKNEISREDLQWAYVALVCRIRLGLTANVAMARLDSMWSSDRFRQDSVVQEPDHVRFLVGLVAPRVYFSMLRTWHFRLYGRGLCVWE